MDWQCVFYIDENGNEPAKDFMLNQSPKAIAEILHVFKLLRQYNINLHMPYVKKIDDSGLRELRIKHSSDIYRILFFAYPERKYILLHAIRKKQDKIPAQEIKRALDRMYDHITKNDVP